MTTQHAAPAKSAGAKSTNHLRTLVIFLIAAVAAGSACYMLRGEQVFSESVRDAGSPLVSLLVELVLGLIIASAVGVLVPKDRISRWLGAESGLRGLAIATGLGMITPGGPFASFPLVLGLSRAGADIGALIAFLTAWAASSASRLLIWEIPMLGFDFAILRFLVSLPLPLIAGYLARVIMARYPIAREQ